jgi:hypothetical protein
MSDVIKNTECPIEVKIKMCFLNDGYTLNKLRKLGVDVGEGYTYSYIPIKSLPDGWSLRSDGNDDIEIHDENGHKLAGLSMVSDDIYPVVEFNCRYGIFRPSGYYSDNCNVYDNKKGCIIAEFTGEGAIQAVIKYLEEHYPDYENPAAYWEDE